MKEVEKRIIGEDNSLLILDDDEPFLRRLAKAMEKRGFSVETAGSANLYCKCELGLGFLKVPINSDKSDRTCTLGIKIVCSDANSSSNLSRIL